MNKKVIPYGRHSVDGADIRAVVRVLKSDRLTQGPIVERFEEAFAKYCGAKYAVAVSSGTAGLHLAGLAAGFKAGDDVLTSPMTFVATPNSVLYAGARPIFTDIDTSSLGIDYAKLKTPLAYRVKGLIHVHFAGLPSLSTSRDLVSRRKDFVLIEDACHALGAEYHSGGHWKKVGCASGVDMTVFSFHPVKHITTGEGGMITTNDLGFYQTLRLLRSHGIEKNSTLFVDKSQSKNPWYYEMRKLGFNYRISDIQCALGLSQLKRVGGFIHQRRVLAEYYKKKLQGVDCMRAPEEGSDTRSSYHLYVLRIDFKKLGKTRAQVIKELLGHGIGTQVHYVPVYRHPFYRKGAHLAASDFPATEAYYEQALSIPLYPSMRTSEASRVVGALQSVVRRARR